VESGRVGKSIPIFAEASGKNSRSESGRHLKQKRFTGMAIELPRVRRHRGGAEKEGGVVVETNLKRVSTPPDLRRGRAPARTTAKGRDPGEPKEKQHSEKKEPRRGRGFFDLLGAKSPVQEGTQKEGFVKGENSRCAEKRNYFS